MGLKADFVIQGGDHAFDSLAVPKARALSLFDLYEKTEQDLGMKVHHTIGNHDVVGIFPASGVSPTDPQYGKKIFADRFGKPYYSFDHKDTTSSCWIPSASPSDRFYEGRIDEEQKQWLANDLTALPSGTPVIVSVHIPLVTAFYSYVPVPAKPEAHHGLSVANADEVIKLFEGHNVLGVLQGHTHINERVEWHGVPYITSGAISGNWWKGTRMGTL